MATKRKKVDYVEFDARADPLQPGQIITLMAVDACSKDDEAFDIEYLGRVKHVRYGFNVQDPVFRFRGKQIHLHFHDGVPGPAPKDGDLALGGPCGEFFPQLSLNGMEYGCIRSGRDYEFTYINGSRMKLYAMRIGEISVSGRKEIELPINALREFRTRVLAGEAVYG